MVIFKLELFWASVSVGLPSSVLDSVAPFLLLQFPLALLIFILSAGTTGITAAHASEPLLDSHDCSVGQINRVDWDHSPQPPSSVIEETNRDDAALGPVQHIPHVLRQTSCIEILASRPKRAIFIVGRATDAVQVEFNQEGRNSQDQVGFQGTRPLEHKVESKEENVQQGRDKVRAVEDGAIAHSQRLCSFLLRPLDRRRLVLLGWARSLASLELTCAMTDDGVTRKVR